MENVHAIALIDINTEIPKTKIKIGEILNEIRIVFEHFEFKSTAEIQYLF